MKTPDINWDEVTDNPKVIELMKKRNAIEEEIKKLDQMALINYELQRL